MDRSKKSRGDDEAISAGVTRPQFARVKIASVDHHHGSRIMIPQKVPLTPADIPKSLREALSLMFEQDEINQWLTETELPDLGQTAMDVFQQCLFFPGHHYSVYKNVEAIVNRIHRAYASMTTGELPSAKKVFFELAETQYAFIAGKSKTPSTSNLNPRRKVRRKARPTGVTNETAGPTSETEKEVKHVIETYDETNAVHNTIQSAMACAVSGEAAE